MIKINDTLIKEYVRLIGATGFTLYSYLKTLKTKRVRISSIKKTLGFSKPTIIRYLKELRKYNLVSIRVKNENGKRTLYIKTKKPGQISLPVASLSINYNIKDTKNTKGKYKAVFNKLLELALSHKRFDHDYYKNKKHCFGAKEEKHIKRLIENVPSVKNYMKWWLKVKSFKMPGLNIGLIACMPMIEEYRLAMGWRVSRETKKEAAAKEKKVDKLKMEMLKALYSDIVGAKKKGKRFKITKDDKGLIKEGIDEGLLVRKANGKLKLNF